MSEVLTFPPVAVLPITPAAASTSASRRSAARKRCEVFSDVVNAYLPFAAKKNAARFCREKARYLRSFEKMFGEIPVEELRPFDLQEWLDTQPGLKSHNALVQAVAAIKTALNWCLDMELIRRNPLARFRVHGIRSKGRRPMERKQFQILMRISAGFFRRYVVFLKFTGARPGEGRALKWSDLKLDATPPIARLEEHKTAAKTGKPRIIQLDPDAVKLLLWIRARRQVDLCEQLEKLLKNGPVKSTEVAKVLRGYGCSHNAVRRAREKVGVVWLRRDGKGPRFNALPDGYVPRGRNPDSDQFVFLNCLGHRLTGAQANAYMQRIAAKFPDFKGACLYQLRHSFGTDGIKNGANLKAHSLALGHASVEQTETYICGDELGPQVYESMLKTRFGEGAFAVGLPAVKPRPVPTPAFPPIDEISAAFERLPSRARKSRPARELPIGLCDVELPRGEEPIAGESALQQTLRRLMGRQGKSGQGFRYSPCDGEAAKAFMWAIEKNRVNPLFAYATYKQVFQWLRRQPDCPFKLPPRACSFATMVYRGLRHQEEMKRRLEQAPAT
jgi:integrase